MSDDGLYVVLIGVIVGCLIVVGLALFMVGVDAGRHDGCQQLSAVIDEPTAWNDHTCYVRQDDALIPAAKWAAYVKENR